MTYTKKSDEDEGPRLCDKCDKPGMWHIRAHTIFVCDEHKRKLEWANDEDEEQRQFLIRLGVMA